MRPKAYINLQKLLRIGKCMERLKFKFENGKKQVNTKPFLVGVVSSGNLEILIESISLNNAFEIEIRTPIRGFESVWEAVIKDFQLQWDFSNLRFTINDMGATPSIVNLRLTQAAQALSQDFLEGNR